MRRKMSAAIDHRQRLLFFGSLYLAQGAMLSYFLTFNILYLREFGLAPADIGYFQATLVLPFVLKILLGLVSDRFSLFGLGHRIPYILVGLGIQITALLFMPMVVLPGGLGSFFVIALGASIGMALYDTSTDGLAVESTPPHERGLVQGVMVGGRAAGILLTLLLGSVLVDRLGWPWVFWTVTFMTLPAVMMVIGLSRQPRLDRVEGFDWGSLRGLLSRNAVALAAVGCLYTLASDGLMAYLSYHAYAEAVGSIGVVGGLVALSMLGRILGAAVSGRLSEPLGYRTTFRVAVSLTAVACVALSVQWGERFLAARCVLFGFAYGFFTTVYAAGAMKLSPPKAAASVFAIFMMFLNIGVALGQLTGGVITEALGFTGLAWSMGALLLVTWLPIRQLTGSH